jgi:glycosyltransferase involved in cell wall biosynthesis
MALSLIIPTTGRETLITALESALFQLYPEDECIVVRHGHSVETEKLVASFPATRYYEEFTDSPYGSDRRNLGMDKATGDYFVFLDDDNALADGALRAIRQKIEEYPGHALFFRLDQGPQGSYGPSNWYVADLTPNNISVENIVVPNDNKTPRWVYGEGPNNEDSKFARQCAELYPYEFIDVITHHYRPHTYYDTK